MILAVTGHRPDKLGGYSVVITNELQALAEEKLFHAGPDLVITGMALGWDQAVAAACHALKIPFHAYVPCPTQDSVWPARSREKYRDLLSYADKIVTVFPAYVPHCMNVRNERMVDACDELLALWNGTAGGTANCLRYARHKGKPVHNCWQDWVQR